MHVAGVLHALDPFPMLSFIILYAKEVERALRRGRRGFRNGLAKKKMFSE